MSIRLALSTTAFPELSLSEVIAKAGAMGYEGLDLATRFGRNTPDFKCDAQQGDASRLRGEMAGANITPVCVTTNISLAAADRHEAEAALAMVRNAGQRAQALGAAMVRVLAWQQPRGQTRQAFVTHLAEVASQAADELAMMGVQLVFENIGAITRVRDWWQCLEAIRHPMIGLYWNAAAAALAGQGPAVWAPTLNTRIRHVRLTDYRLDPDPVPVPVGQGELGVQKMVQRLMGLGFDGFLTVQWDRLASPLLEADEQALAAARVTLSQWIDAIVKAGDAAKPVKKTAAAPARAVAGGGGKTATAEGGASERLAAIRARAAAAKAGGDATAATAAAGADAASGGSSPEDAQAQKKADARAAALARIEAMKQKRAATRGGGAGDVPRDGAGGDPKQPPSVEGVAAAVEAGDAATQPVDAKAAMRAAALVRIEAMKQKRAAARGDGDASEPAAPAVAPAATGPAVTAPAAAPSADDAAGANGQADAPGTTDQPSDPVDAKAAARAAAAARMAEIKKRREAEKNKSG